MGVMQSVQFGMSAFRWRQGQSKPERIDEVKEPIPQDVLDQFLAQRVANPDMSHFVFKDDKHGKHQKLFQVGLKAFALGTARSPNNQKVMDEWASTLLNDGIVKQMNQAVRTHPDFIGDAD